MYVKSKYLTQLIKLYKNKPLNKHNITHSEHQVFDELCNLHLMKIRHHQYHYTKLGLKFCHKYFKQATKEKQYNTNNILFGQGIFSTFIWLLIYIMLATIDILIIIHFTVITAITKNLIIMLGISLAIIIQLTLNDINNKHNQFTEHNLNQFLQQYLTKSTQHNTSFNQLKTLLFNNHPKAFKKSLPHP